MGKHSINHNTANDGNMLLSPVVLEAIQNDAQIKALNQRLNDLVQYNSPRWVQQTNGEFKAVNSLQFDEAFYTAPVSPQVALCWEPAGHGGIHSVSSVSRCLSSIPFSS